MAREKSLIRAFGEEHVERLTGLSKRQLRYWDRTGFFSPSLARGERGQLAGRIYSFRDVVSLRVLGMLRNQHNVPLQHLRRVAEQLSPLGDEIWSRQVLAVHDRRVQFIDESGQARDALSGQGVLIPLERVVHDVAAAADELACRKPAQVGRIERHRNVAHNAWVVAGTRIPTRAIQRFHEAGYTVPQILREYPSLTKRDIEAALAHERRLGAAA